MDEWCRTFRAVSSTRATCKLCVNEEQYCIAARSSNDTAWHSDPGSELSSTVHNLPQEAYFWVCKRPWAAPENQQRSLWWRHTVLSMPLRSTDGSQRQPQASHWTLLEIFSNVNCCNSWRVWLNSIAIFLSCDIATRAISGCTVVPGIARTVPSRWFRGRRISGSFFSFLWFSLVLPLIYLHLLRNKQRIRQGRFRTQYTYNIIYVEEVKDISGFLSQDKSKRLITHLVHPPHMYKRVQSLSLRHETARTRIDFL